MIWEYNPYPLGLLGHHQRKFQVIQSQRKVKQTMSIRKETHMFDSVFRLLRASF